MLQHIEIRHFQSLHDISLDLAPFTVIVGPSSSGKSAFTRALRTLANNRRGLDFLTHGERLCTITAQTEAHTVTLSRGKGTEDNYYELIPTAQSTSPVKPLRYSKLGGEVPVEVSAALGIPQGSQAFASQHDMPYLLNDSAASNASTLGRLTNVNVIFDAARESKRQGLEASKTLRIRQADLQSAEESLSRFEHLDDRQHALSQAEEHITAAYSAQRALNAILTARDTLMAAAGAVKRLSTAAEAPVPAIEPISAVHERITALHSARDTLISAATVHRAAQQALAGLDTQQQGLNDEAAALRANTENIFRERFEAARANQDDSLIAIPAAAAIAAQTVEDISA